MKNLPGPIVVCVGIFLYLGWVVGLSGQPENQSLEYPGVVEALDGDDISIVKEGGERREVSVGMEVGGGDIVLTGEWCEVVVSFPSGLVVRINELTTLKFPEATGEIGVNKGGVLLLKRNPGATLQFRTPLANAAIRGTSAAIEVTDRGTRVTVIDGYVTLRSDTGEEVAARNGEIIEVGVDGRGRQVSGVLLRQAIQWYLYFPFVFVGYPEEATGAWGEVLRFLLAGDYGEARRALPDLSGVERWTAWQRKLAANLVLTRGQVDLAREILAPLRDDPEAEAIERLIGIMLGRDAGGIPEEGAGGTEWMVHSYYLQSQGRLEEARSAAQRVQEGHGSRGFVHGRAAVLHAATGDYGGVGEALARMEALGAEDAPSHVLRAMRQARTGDLDGAFNSLGQAIEKDARFADAWLARGLLHYRRGDLERGLREIMVAVAMHPSRALLRTYLAEALRRAGQDELAEAEFEHAIELDDGDPSAYLFRALLNQNRHRYAEALRDFRESLKRNENRKLVRGDQLLEADSAVRRVNLATMYEQLGLKDFALREAAEAVAADPLGFGPHLFLANAFDTFRDKKRLFLRYDTAWRSEQLWANLLAPPGTAVLPVFASLNEYTPLFGHKNSGFVGEFGVDTTRLATVRSSLWESWGRVSAAVDTEYRSFDGYDGPDRYSILDASLRLRYELGEEDVLMFEVSASDSDNGDIFTREFTPQVDEGYGLEENRGPSLLAAYTRRWGTGGSTFLVAGRDVLVQENRVGDYRIPVLIYPPGFSSSGFYLEVGGPSLEQETDIEVGFLELLHEHRIGPFQLTVGGRVQDGEMVNNYFMQNGNTAPLVAVNEFPLEGYAAYTYLDWEIVEDVILTAGFAWNRLVYPRNFNHPPRDANPRLRTVEKGSPKLGLQWLASERVSLFASWTRSLGGASIDSTYRMEPTLVGGITQTYRSLGSESFLPAFPGQEFEVAGLALKLEPARDWFITVGADEREAVVPFAYGGLTFNAVDGSQVATSFPVDTGYEEKVFTVSLHHLLTEAWTVGVRHRLVDAEQYVIFEPTELKSSTDFASEWESTFFETQLELRYNSKAHWFGGVEVSWVVEQDKGFLYRNPDGSDNPIDPGDEDIFHVNVEAGYRFPSNRWEILLRWENLTDQDYRFTGLTGNVDLPRESTLAIEVRARF